MRYEFSLKIMDYEKTIDFMRINERNITNVIFGMIGLINDKNDKFIYPFKNWYDHMHVILDIPRIFKPTEYYLDLLDKRNYFLNTSGVEVKLFNTGLFKEVRFKEEFLEDGLIVLYRITDDGENKHSMGFIDLRDKYLFSGWLNAQQGKIYHERFTNFILEVYCNLVCNIENNDSGLELKQLNNLNEIYQLHKDQPGYYVEVKENERGVSKGIGVQKSWHRVSAHLRKGNASEMSKANARKYGVILKQGYTFVRPHERGKKE